jgi:hypothetical protein
MCCSCKPVIQSIPDFKQMPFALFELCRSWGWSHLPHLTGGPLGTWCVGTLRDGTMENAHRALLSENSVSNLLHVLPRCFSIALRRSWSGATRLRACLVSTDGLGALSALPGAGPLLRSCPTFLGHAVVCAPDLSDIACSVSSCGSNLLFSVELCKFHRAGVPELSHPLAFALATLLCSTCPGKEIHRPRNVPKCFHQG